MARRRSLVVGHQVAVAGKRRLCRHDRKHVIIKGETLLEIRDGLAWRGYCLGCAGEMIRIARRTLDSIETGMRV